MFFDILPVVRYDTAGFFCTKGSVCKRADGCQSGVLQHKNMSETGDCKGEDKEESQEFMKKLHTYIVWVFVRNMFHGYCDWAGYGLPSDHTEDRG